MPLQVKRKERMQIIIFPLALAALLVTFPLRGVSFAPQEDLLGRAKKIHEKAVTLDAHVDIEVSFITPAFYQGHQQEKFVTLSKMDEGGLDAIVLAVFTGQGALTQKDYLKARALAFGNLELIQSVLNSGVSGQIELASSPADFERTTGRGKKAALIGIENAYPFGEDLDNFRKAARLGVVYVTLCHEGNNQFCDSNTNAVNPKVHFNGLSPLGEKAVTEMNRLGIIVDVSHLSKKSMLDAVRLSRTPVIASHSGCRALCDVPRNMDDEQLLALKKNGGVIHIIGFDDYIKSESPKKQAAIKQIRKESDFPEEAGAFFLAFYKAGKNQREAYQTRLRDLGKKFPRVNIRDYVDHIDHVVKLIGVDHVGVGADFFDSLSTIDGWKDASESSHITTELVKRGYTEEEIEKIWSGNFLRVWKEVQKARRPVN
jgi:membrane dipeptidase